MQTMRKAPFFVSPSQDTGATKKELPIVEEVTSVLREWGIIWKQLYVVRNIYTIFAFSVLTCL